MARILTAGISPSTKPSLAAEVADVAVEDTAAVAAVVDMVVEVAATEVVVATTIVEMVVTVEEAMEVDGTVDMVTVVMEVDPGIPEVEVNPMAATGGIDDSLKLLLLLLL